MASFDARRSRGNRVSAVTHHMPLYSNGRENRFRSDTVWVRVREEARMDKKKRLSLYLLTLDANTKLAGVVRGITPMVPCDLPHGILRRRDDRGEAGCSCNVFMPLYSNVEKHG